MRVLQRLAEETGAKALKFKVGGRMSGDADSLPGRSEKLIALARKTFEDSVTLHADANGSYGVEKAVALGKILEECDYAFFEEPCPFDYLEETKRVADSLHIPIAGGEQESSVWRFRWMIANGAIRVVQPDLHYYGGFIRATRVARMAERAGLPVTLHLSGGLGFADMVHFASYVPNIGPYAEAAFYRPAADQEYKGSVPEAGALFEPPIRLADGALTIPTAPGLGLRSDLVGGWEVGSRLRDELKRAKGVRA